MASDTKILPVALTDEQRSRLKTLAFERSSDMVVLIREWIDEKWGMRSGGPVKPSPVSRKPTQEALDKQTEGYVAVIRGDAPVTDSDVPVKTCWRCKQKVEKWTMAPNGKPWCDECIEDSRNAIP